MTDPEPKPERDVTAFIPERFREDYDPQPYTDPQSGVTYPIDPRDVLDPQEYAEWRRSRR